MQVFWVYVCIYIRIIITSFFASVCFSLTSDSFFCMLSVYCLLNAQFLSHHHHRGRRRRRRRRKTRVGAMRVIRVFQEGEWDRAGIIIQIESFAILSLRVPFLGSLCSNYTFSLGFFLLLPLNYFMEDLLIDCCLWLLVLRALFFSLLGRS